MQRQQNEIEVIKNPTHYEKFIHIDDVISGLTTIVEKDLRGIIELGGGVVASVSDFINTVNLNLGSECIFPWSVPEFKSLQPNYIMQSLGWESSKTTEFFGSKYLKEKLDT